MASRMLCLFKQFELGRNSELLGVSTGHQLFDSKVIYLKNGEEVCYQKLKQTHFCACANVFQK